MRIASINIGTNPTIFDRIVRQNQNPQFLKIVNNINNKFQQRNQSYDIVELSAKAKELLKTRNEKAEKIIDYADSPMIGARTQADWAESSLTQQRNGVASVKNTLAYQKERLESFLAKISEYEKITSGEILQEDTLISKERAAELIVKYQDSIKTDFSEEIDGIIKFYNGWVKVYDEYSSGLASEVMGNVLESITAGALGLDRLSNNPHEILKALDSAIEKLNGLSKSIEDKFYQATGNDKKMLEFASLDMKEDMADWNKQRLASEIAFLEMVTIGDTTNFTGKTLEIGGLLHLKKSFSVLA